MIRYRCPHCAAPTVAHERRVGQSSVCKACLKSHQIPADRALWLTETGELLHPPAAPVEALSATLPDVELPPVIAPEAPHPVAEKPVDLAPTLPEFHLSEPIPVREPEVVVSEPATPVAREPEPVAVPVPAAALREPEPVAPRVSRPFSRPQRSTSAASPAPEFGAVATATPPPQPARSPVPRAGRSAFPSPVPRASSDAPQPAPRSSTDRPYADPVQLQTQADIAVALTAALTSRMKPAPAPRRDLRPSTAAWMILTGIGVAFVLVALFTDLNYRWPALVLGAAQIVIGYAWIVRLTHLRDPKRGLRCAVPLLTPYYLGQHKYAKFRPLRFVLTGAALAGLALASPNLADLTRPLIAKPAPPAPPPNPDAESKLAQLRTFRDQRAYDSLIRLLEVLVKTDPIRSADAKDRAELAAELEALCGHQLTDVRVAAITAFMSWDPDSNAARARAVCLTAVRSPTQEERIRALRLLPRWKDAEVARMVQALIGRPGRETDQARASLEEIGGPTAEQAAFVLLKRAGRDDQAMQLTAIGVLEKVGGPKAADELRTYAMATDHPVVRNSALAAVAVIEGRIGRPQPSKEE